jgi:hypothetical protein
MAIHKKSLEAAQYLAANPEVTALVFKLNAAGESTVDLHEKVNKAYGHLEGHIDLTTWTVRNLLHHKRPYDHPDVYSLVDPKDEEQVRLRFKHMVKPRGKKKNGTCARNHIPLLNEVLEARVVYEKKLDEAVEAGMSRESIVAWCSVVADGSLTQDKGTER